MKNDWPMQLILLRWLAAMVVAALFALGAIGVSGCALARARRDTAPHFFPAALKMQHQIMFNQGNEVYVFDGYLILIGDSFYVKAFAGPGIELFTVIRRGGRQSEQLHIPSLKDRLDLKGVGADIARVYFSGCPHLDNRREAECDFYGEPLIEVRGQSGELVERRFPKAHGIGLRVRYEDYRQELGSALPHKITLNWSGSKNSMVILVVAVEKLDERNGNPMDQLTETKSP